MQIFIALLFWFIIGSGLFAPFVSAQISEPLTIDFKVERKIVREDNSVQWVDGTRAEPGSVLRYQAVYRNQSQGTLRQIKASVPIPENVVCLWQSAVPTPDEVSLDGREFIPWTDFLNLSNTSGDSANLMVRTVRWLIPDLLPGQSAIVSVEAAIPVIP